MTASASGVAKAPSAAWLSALLLLALAMGVVAWIRLFPLTLPGVSTLAEFSAKAHFAEILAAQEGRDPGSVTARDMAAWLEANPEAAERETRRYEQRLREEYTFVTPDGRLHPYLGRYDGYYWLRVARNLLATGSPCDRRENGMCRDDFTLAPVGTEMAYGESFHAWALAGFHRIAALFPAQLPLSTSAMMLPLAVGVLGVIPAFFIGARLAGPVGGLAAGLFTGLNPVFLGRTAGGDNDIWHVVLPLLTVWALVESLHAPGKGRRYALVILSAALVGLHAATWRGWPFLALVCALGLLASLAYETARYAAAGPRERAAQVTAMARVTTIAVAFVAAVVAAAWLVGEGATVLSVPRWLLAHLPVVGNPIRDAPLNLARLWPSTFWEVGELRRVSRTELTVWLGGPWFAAATLGVYLMVLPRRPLNRWDFVAMSLIALCLLYLFARRSSDQLMTIGAVSIALTHAFVLRWRDPAPPDRAGLAAALLIAVWYLAALYQVQTASRFLLLLTAPLGIALGVMVGRAHQGIRRLVSRRWLSPGLAWLVTLAVVIPFAQAGHREGVRYLPDMNDAWWSSLEALRAAPPDAIVTTRWQHGHWAKLVTERRVSADGATLSAHVNQWIARILATDDEKESVGLLRMLNCGSDATPRREGRRGAFGRLTAGGLDSREAYDAILALAVRDRREADAWLEARGVAGGTRTQVLEASHCAPPPSFLVLSDRYLAASSHPLRGLWDFRKAELAALVRRGRIPEVLSALEREYGQSGDQAEEFVSRARKWRRAADRDALASPSPVASTLTWRGCTAEGDELGCELGLMDRARKLRFERFTFARGEEDRGRLQLRAAGGEVARSGSPGHMFIARPDRLEGVPIAEAEFPGLGVLIDPEAERVFVGSPLLIRSVLAQLVLLDGRYTPRFEKLSEQQSFLREVITTWRVHFPADD